MPKSFFGGDLLKSHFTVSVRYRFPSEMFGEPDYGKDRLRRVEQRKTLKGLGFKEKFFQYRNTDKAAKAKAKAEAKAYAKEWSDKAGFELEVVEGCFL